LRAMLMFSRTMMNSFPGSVETETRKNGEL
jgi:hypothetical protein